MSGNSYAARTLNKVLKLTGSITDSVEKMEEKLNSPLPENALEKACFYRDVIIPIMNEIRENTDKLELITDRNVWPVPTYNELLFGVD